jgi:molecular chaperone GrpE
VSRPSPEDSEFDPDRVVIRDKRRIDPESGTLRGATSARPGGPAGQPGRPDPTQGPGGAGTAQPGGGADDGGESPAEMAAAEDALAAELTADLQRITAEYANYRRRVERDRVAVLELATAGLLSELLPVLDDVDRARQHGDLTGAFAAVGEALEAVVAKAGLERFGEPGEPFDPAVHEALMQAEPDPAATVAVCAQVLQPGFRLSGGRVLRPARVSVAEPGAGAAPSGQAAPEDAGQEPAPGG